MENDSSSFLTLAVWILAVIAGVWYATHKNHPDRDSAKAIGMFFIIVITIVFGLFTITSLFITILGLGGRDLPFYIAWPIYIGVLVMAGRYGGSIVAKSPAARPSDVSSLAERVYTRIIKTFQQ